MTRTDDTGSVCFVPCGRRKSRSVIVYHQCEACTGAFHGFGLCRNRLRCGRCCSVFLLFVAIVANKPEKRRWQTNTPCTILPTPHARTCNYVRTVLPGECLANNGNAPPAPRQREGGKGPYGRIGAARKAVVPLECIPYSSVVCVCAIHRNNVIQEVVR